MLRGHTEDFRRLGIEEESPAKDPENFLWHLRTLDKVDQMLVDISREENPKGSAKTIPISRDSSSNKTLEFEGVVFTPEMLEKLRELQANNNQKINDEIYFFNNQAKLLVELGAQSCKDYENVVYSASLMYSYTDFFEIFRNPNAPQNE